MCNFNNKLSTDIINIIYSYSSCKYCSNFAHKEYKYNVYSLYEVILPKYERCYSKEILQQLVKYMNIFTKLYNGYYCIKHYRIIHLISIEKSTRVVNKLY